MNINPSLTFFLSLGTLAILIWGLSFITSALEARKTEKFISIAGAVATIILALATVFLAFGAYDQVAEMRSAQRPFVYLADTITRITDRINEPACCIWQIPSAQNKERVVSIYFLLGNSGNSQTQRLRIFSQCIPIGPPTQPDEPFSRFKWDENGAITRVIAPKQVIQIKGCELTAEDVLNFQMGVIHEYLLGEVRYGDGSNNGQLYVTQFALELHVTGGANDISKFSGFTLGVGQHNCTDEDCPKRRG